MILIFTLGLINSNANQSGQMNDGARKFLIQVKFMVYDTNGTCVFLVQ